MDNQNKSEEKIRSQVYSILEKGAPKAARIYLQEYLNYQEPIYEDIRLVAEAIRVLTTTKNKRAKKHRLAVSAISWILKEIPDDEPAKASFIQWLITTMQKLV